jgi:methyltransferase-like protein
MLITHISVDYGQKINLDNFESVNVSINIHGKPEDGKDADACYEFLLNQAQKVVMSKPLEVAEAHNVTCPSVVKYFAGKETDEFSSSYRFSDLSNLSF